MEIWDRQKMTKRKMETTTTIAVVVVGRHGLSVCLYRYDRGQKRHASGAFLGLGEVRFWCRSDVKSETVKSAK
jgi:hypothetical protein